MNSRFRPSANSHSIVLPGRIARFCCLHTANIREAANPPACATLMNDHVDTIKVHCAKHSEDYSAFSSRLRAVGFHTCRNQKTHHSVRPQKSDKQAASDYMLCATTARTHYNSKQNSHPSLNTISPCSLHAHSPYPKLASTTFPGFRDVLTTPGFGYFIAPLTCYISERYATAAK